MKIFDVKGMTCGHCSKAVETAITNLDASARVSIELSSGKVSIESGLTDDRVIKAIESEGYEAKLVS